VVIWRTQGAAPAERASVVHFTVPLPAGTIVTTAGGIAVSRDGSRVAYTAGPRSQIYVRSLKGMESTLLPDTAGASWLSFSPDGRSISYVDPRELRRVTVDGGRSVRLAEVSTEVSPPVQHWRTDDTILFTSKGVLMRVPAAGGTAEPVGPSDGGPYMLPRVRLDGPTIFAFNRKGAVELDLQRGTLSSLPGPSRTAGPVCLPEFVPVQRGSTSGFQICYDPQNTAILAAPFDAARLDGSGELKTVVEGVQPIVGPFGAFAVSESGTLAYVAGTFQGIGPSAPVWVSRAGLEAALPLEKRRIESIALSPDGQRIAMQVYEGTSTSPQRDIWVYDIARGTMSRLTFDGGSRGTVWTHDSTRIVHAFSRGRTQVRAVAVDGGTPTTMAGGGPSRWVPSSTTRDEALIAGVAAPGDAPQTGVSVVHVGKAGADAQPFMDLPQFSENGARFSPDGRFIAYSSDKTGREEVYVAAYPPGRGEWPVSTDGGTSPRWRADGRELFYRSGNRMIAVAVDTSAGFRAGATKVLFERELFGGPDEPWDVSADGQRFLMLEAAPTTTAAKELHIIVNWIEELKREFGTR
jgi:Tol biopolymer transport system component